MPDHYFSAPSLYGLPWRTGRFYAAAIFYTSCTTTAVSLTGPAIIYSPFFVPNAVTVGTMAIEYTASAPTTTGRFGLFWPRPVDGLPGKLLKDYGTISPAGVNQVYSVSVSQALSPGFYWAAYGVISTSGTFRAFNDAMVPYGCFAGPGVQLSFVSESAPRGLIIDGWANYAWTGLGGQASTASFAGLIQVPRILLGV